VSYRPWEPNAGSPAHIEAVNDVRLLVQQRRPEAGWVCERELTRRPFAGVSDRAHRPDAVVLVEGGRRVAVEVELTLKSRARMERIAARLLSDFDAVWYFAAPEPERPLRELAERHCSRLHIQGLPGAPS
jgi:hypothetical protein